MVDEFNEACFTSKRGVLSVVESQFGVHLIEVTKTRDNVLSSLKALKAPQQELDLLALAKQNSDALVATETRSMRLVLEALAIPIEKMHPASQNN